MASIGRGNLRCKVKGCNRIRPYWADECKRHREPATADETNIVEACFKCGWLSTTGPHTTCSRKPVKLTLVK